MGEPGYQPPLVVPPKRPETIRPTVVEVTVTSCDERGAVAALADGRQGFVERKDLAPGAGPTPGGTLRVAVLSRTDSAGRVLLSHRWASQFEAWDQVEALFAERTPVTVSVLRETKGGVVAELLGLRAFLPGSHFDVEPGTEAGALVGTCVEVLVIELDRVAEKIVVSRRDLVRRQRRSAERSTMSSLTVGARVTGQVVAILEFGAQIELGAGVRGLVHRSEISWNRIRDLESAVAVGQAVEVEVIEINKSRRRVGLSMKRIVADPLVAVELGQVIDAEITSVVEYGAFARLIESGAEGLIHTSQLTEQMGLRPDQIVMTGERVTVKVIEHDVGSRRLGLSITQAMLS